MSDAFGALAIPLTSTATGDAAGDPLLSTSLDFFKAVLNANAAVPWKAVYKDVPTPLVVKTTQTENPVNAPFNERDMPGLFMWRESAAPPVWIADDWLTQKSVCRLQWVMPWAITVKRAVRSSIYNSIARVLLVMTERNRDPSWVDSGDTDPQAASLGSSFFGRAGWLEFEIGAWKPVQIPIGIQGKGTKPQMYEAFSIQCDVTERLTYDLGRFAPIGGLDLTLKTPDGGVGDGGIVTGRTLLP